MLPSAVAAGPMDRDPIVAARDHLLAQRTEEHFDDVRATEALSGSRHASQQRAGIRAHVLEDRRRPADVAAVLAARLAILSEVGQQRLAAAGRALGPRRDRVQLCQGPLLFVPVVLLAGKAPHARRVGRAVEDNAIARCPISPGPAALL